MDRKAEDVAFMKDSDNWPAWPFLPLKKYKSNDSVCGVLWVADNKKAIIHLGNMFNLPKTKEEFKKLPTITYNSFEELVNDGWCVD